MEYIKQLENYLNSRNLEISNIDFDVIEDKIAYVYFKKIEDQKR